MGLYFNVLSFLEPLCAPYRRRKTEARIQSLSLSDKILFPYRPGTVLHPNDYVTMLLAAMFKSAQKRQWSSERHVKQVYFYKNSGTSIQRECIVFECSFPDDRSRPLYLQVIRNHARHTEGAHEGRSPNAAAAFCQWQSSGAPAASTEPAVSDLERLIGEARPAVDLFRATLDAYPFEGSNWQRIGVHALKEPVPLLEGVILVQLLQEKAVPYTFCRSQCLWLTGSVWTVLNMNYPGDGQKAPLVQDLSLDMGKCGPLQIHNPKPEEAEALGVALKSRVEGVLAQFDSQPADYDH